MKETLGGDLGEGGRGKREWGWGKGREWGGGKGKEWG